MSATYNTNLACESYQGANNLVKIRFATSSCYLEIEKTSRYQQRGSLIGIAISSVPLPPGKKTPLKHRLTPVVVQAKLAFSMPSYRASYTYMRHYLPTFQSTKEQSICVGRRWGKDHRGLSHESSGVQIRGNGRFRG